MIPCRGLIHQARQCSCFVCGRNELRPYGFDFSRHLQKFLMSKISVKVIPNSKKNEVIDEGCDLLGLRHFKVKTTQAPEDGKANKAVIELLAEFFDVKKKQIQINYGEASRTKIIEIFDLA